MERPFFMEEIEEAGFSKTQKLQARMDSWWPFHKCFGFYTNDLVDTIAERHPDLGFMGSSCRNSSRSKAAYILASIISRVMGPRAQAAIFIFIDECHANGKITDKD